MITHCKDCNAEINTLMIGKGRRSYYCKPCATLHNLEKRKLWYNLNRNNKRVVDHEKNIKIEDLQ